MTGSPISRRKGEHLRIVLEQDVQHPRGTLLDCVELIHQALPELDWAQIDLGQDFMGRRLGAPLMITGMTGGAEYAGELNRGLAQAAAATGIAFSVGSQRILFHHPEMLPDFAVREYIPEGVLLANLGAAQLLEHSPAEAASLAQRIAADGICLHLNPAQELAQAEGDRDFAGILDAVGKLVELMPGRVLVKETGAGLSPEAVRALHGRGVRCFDVAGAGGTSWTRVESLREGDGSPESRAALRTGAALAGWGLPTAYCIIAARRVCGPDTTIIGSGGITSGLDAARAMACGADVAGFARTALLEFHRGGMAGTVQWIEQVKHELRAVMLLCGASCVQELQRARRVYTTPLRDWLAQDQSRDQERE
jgi:isopentenyl-diphosphate delta-isomerase